MWTSPDPLSAHTIDTGGLRGEPLSATTRLGFQTAIQKIMAGGSVKSGFSVDSWGDLNISGFSLYNLFLVMVRRRPAGRILQPQ